MLDILLTIIVIRVCTISFLWAWFMMHVYKNYKYLNNKIWTYHFACYWPDLTKSKFSCLNFFGCWPIPYYCHVSRHLSYQAIFLIWLIISFRLIVWVYYYLILSFLDTSGYSCFYDQSHQQYSHSYLIESHVVSHLRYSGTLE